MGISEKITELRKQSGLSQEAFAEKIGVSRQSVSKWESGVSLPDVDKVVAICKLFGVPTDYLLMEENNGITEESETNTEDSERYSDTLCNAAQPSENGIKNKKPKKKKTALRIIAAVLVLAIVAAAIGVPVYFGGVREAWWAMCGGKVQYPYVLVHGLGGWGEGNGINEAAQYWGAGTGDLAEYLRSEGYSVYAPSVGPISSAWDRACELYAQLTGTKVDYGAAHSAEHNHERYGRTYDTPLFEGWGDKINGGQRIKINLVGHSFGGATVRLLTSLLETGSEAEIAATGDETSELFKGGKGDWVNSVTTLCAPHNGSSLTCVLDSIGGIVGVNSMSDVLSKLAFGIAGVSSPIDGVYDFQLDQFGIGEINGGNSEVEKTFSQFLDSGTDNAVYDLSPDGAAELNETIKTVEDVYYFSYSYSTTKEGTIMRGQVPESSTLPVLMPFALAMGSYTGVTPGGISIDESWQENDGLVSVISAKAPFGEETAALDESGESFKQIKRGIWNVAETRRGDHGTVIGLNAPTQTTHDFYDGLFTMIDSLKR